MRAFFMPTLSMPDVARKTQHSMQQRFKQTASPVLARRCFIIQLIFN